MLYSLVELCMLGDKSVLTNPAHAACTLLVGMKSENGTRVQARQREEEKLTSAGSGRFDAMLGAIGHGMIRAKKIADSQVGLNQAYLSAQCSGGFRSLLYAEAPLALGKHSRAPFLQ